MIDLQEICCQQHISRQGGIELSKNAALGGVKGWQQLQIIGFFKVKEVGYVQSDRGLGLTISVESDNSVAFSYFDERKFTHLHFLIFLRSLQAEPFSIADNQFNPRFQPCYSLLEANIPCVVWSEDAIAHYGVPTVLFQLQVLVPNIDEAANVLIQKGWYSGENAQTKFGNASLSSAHRCLMPPIDSSQTAKSVIWTPIMGPPPPPSKGPPGPVKTILLPAVEWNFILPRDYQHPNGGCQMSLFPLLPDLLDALIDKLLDDPLTDSMFWGHLAVLIAYLYGYVPVIREKSFAKKLKLDHRQFHFDWLSGMSTGTLPFIHHERRIRDALREGTYQLRDCSTDRNDETLFTAKTEARIMASRPSPFSHEDY